MDAPFVAISVLITRMHIHVSLIPTATSRYQQEFCTFFILYPGGKD